MVNVSCTITSVPGFEALVILRPGSRRTTGQSQLLHHQPHYALIFALLRDDVSIQVTHQDQGRLFTVCIVPKVHRQISPQEPFRMLYLLSCGLGRRGFESHCLPGQTEVGVSEYGCDGMPRLPLRRR